MGKERFFEGCFRALPAIVIDHDVGTLAEAGQRLMRRRRGVDAKLYRIRIRQEMRVEHLRILRIDLAVLLLERRVLGAILLGGITLTQRFA